MLKPFACAQDDGTELRVPEGFVVSAPAFDWFLSQDRLRERIRERLLQLDPRNREDLRLAGRQVRQWMRGTALPAPLVAELEAAFRELTLEQSGAPVVSIRATFASWVESTDAAAIESPLLASLASEIAPTLVEVFVSLFENRNISQRIWNRLDPVPQFLTTTVQRVVRNDRGVSGLLLAPGRGTGFDDVILLSASYGLAETVTHGVTDADEYYVHKSSLRAGRPAVFKRHLGAKERRIVYGGGAFDGSQTDGAWSLIEDVPEPQRMRFCLDQRQVETLARGLLAIESREHWPIEVEWGLDSANERFYMLNMRPHRIEVPRSAHTLESFHLNERGQVLTTGCSVGNRIGAGPVRVVSGTNDLEFTRPGEVIVADMTAPDWEPYLRHAAAIITQRGGRTCHTSIIAREMGIPAVVGCEHALSELRDIDEATVSCAEGPTAYVYKGRLDFGTQRINLDTLPELPINIMINTGNPDLAFDHRALPCAGIGSARLEFIISRGIGIHPKAALAFPQQPGNIRSAILKRCAGYVDPVSFYVEKLAEGIATLAVAFHPRQVIVRLSDFKSNEYANLIGGAQYEPTEENPMLGFRGASRYVSTFFRECFELECQALTKVRNDMGLANVDIMVPFVRTVDEGRQVVDLLAQNGLPRGHDGLRIMMMCETPANALLADEFLAHFDGFSIGSNDLTQLTLGLDRDSALVAQLFDEADPAVRKILSKAIQACQQAGKYVGICGQGASDNPRFLDWILDQGVESLCLNPDSVIGTWLRLAERWHASA